MWLQIEQYGFHESLYSLKTETEDLTCYNATNVLQ
jgi:hypothetical protein